MAIESPLYLIDGSGFLYRAYYGTRPLHTSTGIPVQAVYSFIRMINKLAKKFNPGHMVLIWDSPGKTSRQDIYPEYKATRQAAPSDLFNQKKSIEQFADAIGLKQLAIAGVEADDIIYSLVRDYKAQAPIVMVTSDKDMIQLIDDERVKMYDPLKESFVTEQEFETKMGFPLKKFSFYHAILGDSSDNIPGVHGIGKKGATDLVQQFDSLDDLYKNLDAIKKERTRLLLQEQKHNAYLSHALFLLQYHQIPSQLKDFIFDKDKNWHKARPLFEELEFKSLLQDLDKQGSFIQPEKKIKLTDVTPYKMLTVQTIEQLNDLVSNIKQAGIMAVDVEGTALDPLKTTIVGLCLAYNKGVGYYIPFGHNVNETQLSKEVVFNHLGPLFLDTTIKKIMHHAKYDELVLLNNQQTVEGLAFDTLIAGALVTKDYEKIGLKKLSLAYLNEPMLNYSDVVTDEYKNFSYVPLAVATEYAAADAHQTLQLYHLFKEKLKEQNMEKLYYDIELPLVNVLLHMQFEGIYCDIKILKRLDEKVSRDLELLRQEILSFLPEELKEINLNSPKQLEQLLFETLKLPPQKKSSKRTAYSTDVEVLTELAKIHPVPGLLLKYRELTKLKSTYLDALPRFVNKKTGKIHTNYNQTQVATGRLASSDPNLQNIPLTSTYDIHIRSAFKPKEGHVFLSADYSQIELRVLAFLSQDKALIEAFLQDRDIHAQTASKIFSIPLDQVTTHQRQIGKRINFSILYGLTPYGLSKDLNIPFKEAKEYIEKYFAQYPAVSAWMDNVIEETKRNGYVTTYFGRRRYVPGIYEKNKVLYDLAKRIAINTVAQGTAAEIMKLGMIKLEQAFKEPTINAQMILQIHDELLISVCADQQHDVENLVRTILEHVVTWNIPLKVTTARGNNWYEVSK